MVAPPTIKVFFWLTLGSGCYCALVGSTALQDINHQLICITVKLVHYYIMRVFCYQCFVFHMYATHMCELLMVAFFINLSICPKCARKAWLK
jgi:hypothetical protein